MTASLLVAGGVNVDVHLFGERTVETEPEYAAADHIVAVGGKGANAARAAASLGARASIAAVVGDDPFGREAVAALDTAGVDTTAVRCSSSAATGFAAIRLEGGRHHTLVFSPGANEELVPGDVERAAAVAPPDVVVAQAEVPEEVARWLAGARFPLVFDPCPTGRAFPDVLGGAIVVTPNRVEAAELTGIPEDAFDPWTAGATLVERGAAAVAIKLGPEGTLLADAAGMTLVPTLQVAATDETGAGDVFAAAIAVQIAEGVPLTAAARFAGVASALSVRSRGVAFPSRVEVDEALQRLE